MIRQRQQVVRSVIFSPICLINSGITRGLVKGRQVGPSDPVVDSPKCTGRGSFANMRRAGFGSDFLTDLPSPFFPLAPLDELHHHWRDWSH